MNTAPHKRDGNNAAPLFLCLAPPPLPPRLATPEIYCIWAASKPTTQQTDGGATATPEIYCIWAASKPTTQQTDGGATATPEIYCIWAASKPTTQQTDGGATATPEIYCIWAASKPTTHRRKAKAVTAPTFEGIVRGDLVPHTRRRPKIRRVRLRVHERDTWVVPRTRR